MNVWYGETGRLIALEFESGEKQWIIAMCFAALSITLHPALPNMPQESVSGAILSRTIVPPFAGNTTIADAFSAGLHYQLNLLELRMSRW